jgi:hypothetical protein
MTALPKSTCGRSPGSLTGSANRSYSETFNRALVDCSGAGRIPLPRFVQVLLNRKYLFLILLIQLVVLMFQN